MLAATLRQGPAVRLLKSCFGGLRATHQWEWMRQQGHEINPCNSKHHPAVKAGLQPAADQTPVQEAYTPNSICWGCGKHCVVAVLLYLLHYVIAQQRSNCLRCAGQQQMLITVHMPGTGLQLHNTPLRHCLLQQATFCRSPECTRPEAEKLSSRGGP